MTYLLFWYHDDWHVILHNRTMNTHIIDTRADHWCRGLPRPRPAAPLPQPAAHLALATSFGTERMQGKINAKCQHCSQWVYGKWRSFYCKSIHKTVNGVFWFVQYWCSIQALTCTVAAVLTKTQNCKNTSTYIREAWVFVTLMTLQIKCFLYSFERVLFMLIFMSWIIMLLL